MEGGYEGNWDGEGWRLDNRLTGVVDGDGRGFYKGLVEDDRVAESE